MSTHNILLKTAYYFFIFVFMPFYVYASKPVTDFENIGVQTDDSWDMHSSVDDLRKNELHMTDSYKKKPISIEALESAKLQIDENSNRYDVYISAESLEEFRQKVLILCRELDVPRNDCVHLYLVIESNDNKTGVGMWRLVVYLNDDSWVIQRFVHCGKRINIKPEHLPLFLPVIPQ